MYDKERSNYFETETLGMSQGDVRKQNTQHLLKRKDTTRVRLMTGFASISSDLHNRKTADACAAPLSP